MKLNLQQRAIVSNILVGCGAFRVSMILMNLENTRIKNLVRNNLNQVAESLTGSEVSIREAVNAWDRVKEVFDEAMPSELQIADDLYCLLGAIEDSFQCLVSTLSYPVEPDLAPR